MANRRELVYEELVDTIQQLGYPREFGIMIADALGGEKSISRMSSYIHQFRPNSAEEIADEMLSILSDNEKWKNKKIAEKNNQKLNILLNDGLDENE